jgi:hypothetical protein
MPKKPVLTVEDFVALVLDRLYPCRVQGLSRDPNHNSLSLILVHCSPEQEGRTHRFSLSLPIRPAGRTASFIAACDFPVQPGSKIAIDGCEGHTVLVRFNQNVAGDYEPVAFEPLKEISHVKQPDRPATTAPELQADHDIPE